MKPSKILLLRTEIESDLADLEKVVSEIARLRIDIGTDEPSYRPGSVISFNPNLLSGVIGTFSPFSHHPQC